MAEQDRSPITDSPWFWVLAFSLMACLALVAISGKYGRRQAGIERKYQARERLAAEADSESTADEESTRREFATPGETLVPLWPLAAVLGVVALFAGVMLVRGQTTRRGGRCPRPGSLSDEGPPT